MKRIVLFILPLCFLIGNISAQESCSTYYPFKKGASFEITSYSKKDKVAAVSKYEVTNIEQTAAGEVATISAQIEDEKNKPLAESTFEVNCSNGKTSIDYKSLVPTALLEQYKDMDYKLSGTNLEIPNNLQVGESLPDADMIMNVSMAGIGMKLEFSMTDRKVTNKESVTTPAGTFDCLVITYNTEMKMGMKRSGSGKQWIAQGVGMVKQEDYNTKGKETSSSMLTAFSG
tara:strand:+ start:1196 stop:1885 length:690 start_codon:yes stop_codon:yes gene_type:complete